MYKISKEQLQELLNYLGTRPYMEVASLISKILQLEEEKEKNGDNI